MVLSCTAPQAMHLCYMHYSVSLTDSRIHCSILITGSQSCSTPWLDSICHKSPHPQRLVALLATLAHVSASQLSVCGCDRLEIEAQERALEQLEKSTQEATRKAHDAEQRARSAQETLKANLSFLFLNSVYTLVCS